MENDSKKEPKREPKSVKNWKKELQKLMRKIIDFWIIVGKSAQVWGKAAVLETLPFRAAGTLRVGNQQKNKQPESKQPNQQIN